MRLILCVMLWLVCAVEERAGDRPTPGHILVEKFETHSIIELLCHNDDFGAAVEVLEWQRRLSDRHDPDRKYDLWDESCYRFFLRALKLESPHAR